MARPLDSGAIFIARLALAALFLWGGAMKLLGYAGFVGYLRARGVPFVEIGAPIATAIEVLGGILLVVGFLMRPLAIVMAIYTIVAAVIGHDFWNVVDPSLQRDMAFISGKTSAWQVVFCCCLSPEPVCSASTRCARRGGIGFDWFECGKKGVRIDLPGWASFWRMGADASLHGALTVPQRLTDIGPVIQVRVLALMQIAATFTERPERIARSAALQTTGQTTGQTRGAGAASIVR